MGSVAKRLPLRQAGRGLLAFTGLGLLAVISLAVWLGPTASDNPAAANHNAAIAIDTDPSGNQALSLGTIQACRNISLGQVIDLDLVVTGLDDLAAFEVYIKYDKNVVKFTKPGDSNQTPGSDASRFMLQNAQPSPPGNNVYNLSETLPDAQNDGLYRVSAADLAVIEGQGDPDPINHQHMDGVLVRLQLQGIGSGYSTLQIRPINMGIGYVGPTLTDSYGHVIGDGNGDSFIDNATNATIVVGSGTCSDSDGDGVPDASDNCPTVSNADQANFDGDSQGDACDIDDDNDGLVDTSEPATGCTLGSGGRLDPDCDDDNVSDGPNDPDGAGPIVAGPDNCISVANTSQTNTDGDALGDACDPDDDNDTMLDGSDNCPTVSNASQANYDGDSMGDACDPDADNDGFDNTVESNVVTNWLDNCGNPTSTPPIYSQAWPADLAATAESANLVNISDLVSYLTPEYLLNTNPGDPKYRARWDIAVSGPGEQGINIGDITKLLTLAPPMFNGQRAYFGPACTP